MLGLCKPPMLPYLRPCDVCLPTTPANGFQVLLLAYPQLPYPPDEPMPVPQAELSRGMARRAVGATSQNEHSSRSHAVVRIELVVARPVLGADETVTPGKPLLATQRATLQLVDLAGALKVSSPRKYPCSCDDFPMMMHDKCGDIRRPFK